MNRNAFTLIELLVVISIISLLASIVMPGLQSARESAELTAIKSEVHELLKIAHTHLSLKGDMSEFVNHGWIRSAADCETRIRPSAIDETKAEELCKSIIKRSPGSHSGGNQYYMYLGANYQALEPSSPCSNSGSINCFSINLRIEGDPSDSISGSTGWYCKSTNGNVLESHTFTHIGLGCERNP